ncbi:T9SS type A sorting domain-containing protein [bacterium]|nr:T9SS type A sorting domain-containing protein [bacterium]
MKRFFSYTALCFLMLCNRSYCIDGITLYFNSNDVNDIAADDRHIWCATSGGLVRWDIRDDTYRVFSSLDGLPSNDVHAVTATPGGVLWLAGSWYGLTSMDGGTFHTYDNPGLYGGNVQRIAVDSQENVWCTGASAWRFDGDSWTDCALGEGSSEPVVMDGDGHVWIGTRKGLVCIDGADRITYTTESGLPDNRILSLESDGRGNLWAGTSKGLAVFDGASWRSYSKEYYTDKTVNDDIVWNPVYAVAIDSTGVVWLGTPWGAASFDGTSWAVYTPGNSGLKDREIRNIAVDSDNTKWFAYLAGSPVHALSSFDGSVWRIHQTEGPPSNTALRIGIGADDIGWFAFVGYGTSIFDGKTWTKVTPPELPSYWTFYDFAANGGVCWFATGAGALSYDGSRWTHYTVENSGLASDNVTAVAVDHDGAVWFGMEGRVSKFDGAAWETYTVGAGMGDLAVTVIAVDERNCLWVGTNRGLACFDGLEWTTGDSHGLFDGKVVKDIAIDLDRTVWVCTYFGIGRYDGSLWTMFTTENSGLADNSIVRAAVDRNNVKWFAYGQPYGIIRYDGSSWQTITCRDGLASDQMTDIAVDSKNRKWFTSYNGITSFLDQPGQDPSNIEPASAVPERCIIQGVYPNPFNSAATIRYTLRAGDSIELAVFAINGQRVRTLVDEPRQAGDYTVSWNGTDENGHQVSTGLYIARLQSGDRISLAKILLVR